MGVEVAATCFNWSQLVVVPHHFPSSSSNTLASVIISTHSSNKGSPKHGALVCRPFFGNNSIKLLQYPSCNTLKIRNRRNIISKACSSSSNLDGFSDEEFAKEIQELASKFDMSNNSNDSDLAEFEGSIINRMNSIESPTPTPTGFQPSKMERIEPPWIEREEVIPASIERKAKSVDLPLSLRLIKRKKKQWEEGFISVGESAYCSVKKAFSSMVFIIREIQSYTLQMREILFYEDLKGILARVQGEMNASFVWLFQQVFSHTPTLMVSVMILLANFTVYSMSNNNAAIAAPPPPVISSLTSSYTESEKQNQQIPRFDSSIIKSFSVSSSPFEGNDNGGNGNGKFRSIASGADGGGDGSSSLNLHSTIIPDDVSQVSTFGNKMRIMKEEELKLWNSIVEEASKMLRELRDDSLDEETIQRLVSPVTVEIEPEDYTDYAKTELQYRLTLSLEPKNPLLLFNYAQFLYLVVHDHDRAEEYFKRAIQVDASPDAEALNHYANFLWVARKDLGRAEETYLEAIAADPGNTYHAANYAHFLWNTGGDDTCYPLSHPSSTPTANSDA